jgi:hypothetical protein
VAAAVSLGGTGIFSPIQNPGAWDVIVIGGVASPGVCYLSGFKRLHEFDKKKGKGTQGATLTFTQKPPVEGTVKFLLGYQTTTGTVDHFDAWGSFVKLLKYDPTRKSVQAIDIYHPALAFIDVVSCVCTEIEAPQIEGDPGQQLYTITIKLCEYNPPKKKSAVGTPTTAISNSASGVAGAAADPVQDAQQKEIAALLAQAAAP